MECISCCDGSQLAEILERGEFWFAAAIRLPIPDPNHACTALALWSIIVPPF